MATNYDINYDDERFTKVETGKQEALNEIDQTYGEMIGNSDSYYEAQINASKDWADKQSQLQQEQTDFTIEQIEQQKDQSHKDYLKEQSGAYVDWQKQSNKFGAEAERQASVGLTGTGYSESSQVSMYNTYQNRVATARESYTKAVLNYDNAIKDARLQNNAALAEIAYQALQQQLELSLQGFQYKNQLILEQANKKLEVDSVYYNRYMDVLNQINYENQFAEEIRQFEENYKLQQEQLSLQKQELEENIRQFNQSYELKVKEYEEGIRQFNEEIERLKKKDAQEYELEIKQLELQKKQLEQEQKQWEAEMQLKKEQLAEEQRQFNEQLSYSKSKSSSSGGGGTSSSTGSYTIEDSGDRGTPTINMDSVAKLGLGAVSETKLAQLVAEGKVKKTLKNGQYYFEWVDPVLKGAQMPKIYGTSSTKSSTNSSTTSNNSSTTRASSYQGGVGGSTNSQGWLNGMTSPYYK